MDKSQRAKPDQYTKSRDITLLPNVICKTEVNLVTVSVVFIAIKFAQSTLLMGMIVSRKLRPQTFTEIIGHANQIKFKEQGDIK